MIPSSGVESSAKKSDWDLTSSATGTVKRRPTSLESCKSSSPNENAIDFPTDSRKTYDKDSASCNINKTETDLSQEVVGGRGSEDDEAVKKAKKRFFDIKLAESAKRSISSRLKLPNRVSLVRRTSSNNKLSLSQLERQNNLFIRDGQAEGNNNNINSESRISKEEERSIVMESNNPKQKQDNLSRSKKSSLIPAFLGGGTKPANHIKIPSTSSGSVKKAQNVVEKLAKTGSRFKELYRDFPGGDARSSAKRNPPPYRPPPAPPACKQNQLNIERQQKRIRFSENESRNYEEIDAISVDDDVGVDDDDMSSTVNNQPEDVEGISLEMRSDDDVPRAEYNSNVFKNIPVRQRKCAVSHMENYCLFDPSVDFCNEKELMKKKLIEARMTAEAFQVNEDESIEDVTFEDQTVYDVSELDEREKLLAHHNYYEIDPELLLEEDEDNEAAASEPTTQVERKQVLIVKEKRSQSVKHRKSKIYSNTCSTSSESTSTSQTSTNSGSTTTSTDYPSMFNSVIETTHSSTVESTDENDSNGYGKVSGETINQVEVDGANESVITISNAVTCGESNASSTGATKKKSPQLNRIIRPSSSSSATRNTSNKQQQTSSLATKSKSNKSNLPFCNKSVQLEQLKSSHSLPHLQNVSGVQNRSRQKGNNEMNFVIDNTTTIQLRRQHSSHQGRPLSGHSDDRDSGFLSPVTPPDSHNHPTHITPNVIIKESEPSTKTESTLLNQCDNIQQLIEVSNRVTCERWTSVEKHILC